MTCIVAIKDGHGGVLMGADSAVSGGCGARAMAGSKLVRHGEFLMGISGTARIAQVVQHGFTPPKTDKPDLGYMVTAFSKALMAALDEYDIQPPDDHGHGNHFDILVAVRGELYVVNTDFNVNMFPEPYAAIGCADMYALGAFEALRNGGMGVKVDHKTAAELALKATLKYSAHVLEPFVFERLEPYEAPAAKPSRKKRPAKKKAAKRPRR